MKNVFFIITYIIIFLSTILAPNYLDGSEQDTATEKNDNHKQRKTIQTFRNDNSKYICKYFKRWRMSDDNIISFYDELPETSLGNADLYYMIFSNRSGRIVKAIEVRNKIATVIDYFDKLNFIKRKEFLDGDGNVFKYITYKRDENKELKIADEVIINSSAKMPIFSSDVKRKIRNERKKKYLAEGYYLTLKNDEYGNLIIEEHDKNGNLLKTLVEEK